jgi:hypothetical protein
VNRVAVGEETGEVELNVDEDSVIASSIQTSWVTKPARFATIRLDDYCHRNGIDRVAVLKIDTEGMELGVLRGAAEVLSRTEQIALETHGRERHETALELLGAAGFEITKATFGESTGMVFAARRPSDVTGTGFAHRD